MWRASKLLGCFMVLKTMKRFPVGLSLFATAYDPLDLATDSIDPLGFQRSYLAIADRMLPGFTTVTSNPRYLPMLCAGLLSAERLHPRDESREPAKTRGKRLEVMQNFEKLWALGCGLAEETRGEQAVAGLRGIRYVQKYLGSNAASSELSTGDFTLLSSQVRYGGIGTYGQMLEACHFVDWTSLTLRPLGEQLAHAFPPPNGWSAERPNARMPKNTLRTWGEDVCLGTLTSSEARTMCKGLSGGLEAERDDDVRWTCLHLLRSADVTSDAREEDCLKRFRSVVEQEPLGDARKSAAIRQLRVVASLIEPLEQLYQSLLFIFDEIRARATENPAGLSLISLDESKSALEALAAAQRSERELRRSFALASQVNIATSAPIAQAMRESGVTGLAELVANAHTVAEAARILIQRHIAVQSGKFDRGQPKASWLRLDDGNARLASQRNELQRGQQAKSWRHVPRHPYRTWAAGRFIQQCHIT
jgi:hypothetical protein